MQDKIYKLQTGSAQPHVYSKNLQNFKIPIPSLKQQEEIVKYLDILYEANKKSNEKIAELKKLNEYCITTQKLISENESKKIEELFKFNTSTLQATKCDESKLYPVISSSIINHTHGTFKLDGENLFTLKIFDGDTKTKVKYYNGKCNFTSLLYHMQPINNNINLKYMYYYLNIYIIYIAENYQKGACNKSLDLDLFLKYRIALPPIERQKELVEYLDFNTLLIEQLEKEIYNNKKQAENFLNTVIKAKNKNIDDESSEVDEQDDQDEQDEESSEQDE
jgi:type I restriction enzyme S subunit